jgi:hypothetical protein
MEVQDTIGRLSIGMDRVIPLHDPANYAVVIARIRKIFKNGIVIILPHAQRRMRLRNIDNNDIRHIILYGKIVKHELPVGATNIRYTIRGEALSGNRRFISCAVEVTGHLLIVTVF